MYRRKVCALLLAFLLAWGVPSAHCEATSAQKLLLIYLCPEDAPGAQTLSVLKRLMLYMNLPVDYVNAHQVQISLEEYSAVIIYAQEETALDEPLALALRDSEKPLFVIGQGALTQLVPSTAYAHYSGAPIVRFITEANEQNDVLVHGEGLTLLTGETNALGGTILIASKVYPLCQSLGQVTHLAYFNPEMPAMCTALATQLQAWMWPYENEPTTYGQYLVLDNVYPFMEPAKLMEITDMLEQEGVPYALTLMPIYANAEYPSMKRFCEYLRYVQSTGAGLILRVPLASLGQVDIDELKRHITISYDAYSQYSVYPLAIQAPEEYLLCADGLDVASIARTIFIFEAESTVDVDATNANIAYREGHQIIAPAYTTQSAFTTSYAQAIYLDPNEDVDVLREQVVRIKNSKRVLKSLSQMHNSLYIGEQYIRAGVDGLFVNEQWVDTAYTPFTYDSEYAYDRGFLKYFTGQIEMSNKITLACVSIACMIFLCMIALSRRLVKREIILGTHAQKTHKKPKHTAEKPRDLGGE